jgi:hypothetical protein
MKLFQTMAEWLRKRGWLAKQYGYQSTRQEDDTSQTEKFVCAHGKTKHNFKVMVLGIECEFKKSPMCPPCTEQYLNKVSTLCASCKRPIFPGTPVGQVWHGAPHSFTHLTFECCDTGGLYCGQWGEGRLLTLHELNPEKYPAGTSSVIDHAVNTRGMVIENVD